MNVLHIVFNPVIKDIRVMKEVDSLSASPHVDSITVFGLKEPHVSREETLKNGVNIVRLDLVTRRLGQNICIKILKYIELTFTAIFRAVRLKPDVCHCHDLEALPLGFLISKITGAKLIYDAHELETEAPFIRQSLKPLAFAIENRLAPSAFAMFCVSDSIINWYKKHMKVEPLLLRNVHGLVPLDPNALKKEKHTKNIRFAIKAKPDDILVTVAGFFRPEVVDLIIDIARLTTAPHVHFVFVGKGERQPVIEALANEKPTVHHLPFVDADDVMPMLATADIGIDFHLPTSLNTLYSLPNKLFSYLGAEIPVIVTDAPDKGALINHYNCGWTFKEKPEDVAAFLESLTQEELKQKQQGACLAKQQLCWEKESQVLLDVYANIKASIGN